MNVKRARNLVQESEKEELEDLARATRDEHIQLKVKEFRKHLFGELLKADMAASIVATMCDYCTQIGVAGVSDLGKLTPDKASTKGSELVNHVLSREFSNPNMLYISCPIHEKV